MKYQIVDRVTLAVSSHILVTFTNLESLNLVPHTIWRWQFKDDASISHFTGEHAVSTCKNTLTRREAQRVGCRTSKQRFHGSSHYRGKVLLQPVTPSRFSGETRSKIK